MAYETGYETEYETGYEAEHEDREFLAEILPGEAEAEYENLFMEHESLEAGILGEAEVDRLAAELLEVQTEQELDRFLPLLLPVAKLAAGALGKMALKGAAKFGAKALGKMAGKAVGQLARKGVSGALKNIAKRGIRKVGRNAIRRGRGLVRDMVRTARSQARRPAPARAMARPRPAPSRPIPRRVRPVRRPQPSLADVATTTDQEPDEDDTDGAGDGDEDGSEGFLGNIVGSLFGEAEAESLGEAELEYEAAKRFVRFGNAALRNAVVNTARMPPRAAIREGIRSAAQRHAPALLRPVGCSCAHAAPAPGGDWVREGRNIVLRGV